MDALVVRVDEETTTITVTTVVTLPIPNSGVPPTQSMINLTSNSASFTIPFSASLMDTTSKENLTMHPLVKVTTHGPTRGPLPPVSSSTQLVFLPTPHTSSPSTTLVNALEPRPLSTSSSWPLPTRFSSLVSSQTHFTVQSSSQQLSTSTTAVPLTSPTDGSSGENSSMVTSLMGGIVVGGILTLVVLCFGVWRLVKRHRKRQQKAQHDTENPSTPDSSSSMGQGEEVVIYKGQLFISDTPQPDEKLQGVQEDHIVKRPVSKPNTVATTTDDGISVSTSAFQSISRVSYYMGADDQFSLITPTKLRPDSDILPPEYQEDIPPVPPLNYTLVPDTPTSTTSYISHRTSSRTTPRGPRPARSHSTRRRTASAPSSIAFPVSSPSLSPNIPTVEEDALDSSSPDAMPMLSTTPCNGDYHSTFAT